MLPTSPQGLADVGGGPLRRDLERRQPPAQPPLVQAQTGPVRGSELARNSDLKGSKSPGRADSFNTRDDDNE